MLWYIDCRGTATTNISNLSKYTGLLKSNWLTKFASMSSLLILLDRDETPYTQKTDIGFMYSIMCSMCDSCNSELGRAATKWPAGTDTVLDKGLLGKGQSGIATGVYVYISICSTHQCSLFCVATVASRCRPLLTCEVSVWPDSPVEAADVVSVVTVVACSAHTCDCACNMITLSVT